MSSRSEEFRQKLREKFEEVVLKAKEELEVAFRNTRPVLPEVDDDEQFERLKSASGAAVANSIEVTPTGEGGGKLTSSLIINEGDQARALRVWGNQDPFIEWKNRLGGK